MQRGGEGEGEERRERRGGRGEERERRGRGEGEERERRGRGGLRVFDFCLFVLFFILCLF